MGTVHATENMLGRVVIADDAVVLGEYCTAGAFTAGACELSMNCCRRICYTI